MKKLFYSIITLLISQTVMATRYYVNDNASGSNNGSSWTNAFTSLQSALAVANSSDEVWVAAGTYKPDVSSRSIVFAIPSGVKVYGGFAGNENTLGARDISLINTTNLTILSGDLSDNDAGFSNRSDNSYRIVTFSNATTTTILDGFKISGANNINGNSTAGFGGGIYNDGSGSGNSSNPAIINCTITYCSAFIGGGMYNDGTSGGNASPTITNCIFISNVSDDSGAGLANYGTSGNSSPTIDRCSFIGNAAGYNSGAVNNHGLSGICSPTIINSIFIGNYAANNGGVMVNTGGTSVTTITNCSFSGNTASGVGGVIRNNSSSAIIKNSIVWGNNSLFDNNGGDVTATYSIIEGGYTGTGNLSSDPLFVTQPSYSSAPTITGDLHLTSGSPGINAGTNTDAPTIDLEGNTRTNNDMGAYEYIAPVCTPVATSTDGMNWTGAVSSDWSNPCNWSPNGVPTATNPVTITSFTYPPRIYAGTNANAAYVDIIVSDFEFIIDANASLNTFGSSTNFRGFYLRNGNVTITNNGTITTQPTNGLVHAAFQTESAGNSITNNGTMSIDVSLNRVGFVKAGTNANLSINNSATGIINFSENVEYGFNVTSTNSVFINSGVINYAGSYTCILLTSGEIFTNNGKINIDSDNSTSDGIIVNSGASLVNNACGEISATNAINNAGTITNAGLLKTEESIANTGAFTNNGTLKYASSTGNAIVNNSNSSIIVNNTPTPIFTYGGAYNGTVNGIFTDEAATVSAGTFTAPNTFTPNGNVVSGSQTLYAKITPDGGACEYIVPFTYLLCTNTASISYSGTPYCKTASPANVSLTGTSGGTFTSAPVGLSINSSNGQITPGSSTAGTYTITYTIAASGGCASATATTSVTITNNPSASISYSGTPYCQSASASNVSLTGSSGGIFSSAPVGLSINSSNGQITPGSSTAGTYTITYTIAASGGCASATATTSVTITNNPGASISYSGTPYCQSASASNVTLTGSSGGIFSSAPVGLTINPSSGQITPNTSTAGTYTVTYTIAASGGCASATATTSVTITNNPSASITGTDNLSCVSTSVTRTASGGTTYVWSGGLGTDAVANISSPGTYTVTVTNTGGCSATATTSVTINTTPPNASITGGNNLTCSITSVTRTASGGATYAWSNSLGNNPTANITSPGTYTVTVTGVNGCSATATTSVTFTNDLSVTASNTGPYMIGQTIELNATGGATYAWIGPDGFTSNLPNPSIINALSANGGIYTVTVFSNSCTATATTNVVVNGLDPCDSNRIVDYLYVKAGNPYQTLFPLTNGMVINQVPDLTSILVVPVCDSIALESFEINIQGPGLNWNIIQNVNPFSLFDNLGVNVNGRNLVPGNYTLTVTGYAQDNKGGGLTYGPVITRFTIVGNSATISVPVINGSEFCAGNNVAVNFSATGTFEVGNQFQAQLSDANGSYANPVIIGTSNTVGTINTTIPLNTPEGSNYSIRVVSTNQVMVGSPTNNLLTINPFIRNLMSPNHDFTGISTQKTSNAINANNKLSSTATVTYQAGNAILLTPGFEANAGAVFKAEIQGCGN